MQTEFAKLTFDREMACGPEALFGLLTDRDARQIWTAPSDTIVIEIDSSDMRPGGREVARCGPRDNPEFVVVADFHIVDAPHRLIFPKR